mgnify:CR=1 FL=1
MNAAFAPDLLARAESLRRQTLAAFSSLSADLDSRLAGYRSQRAWRVMLGVREAYTKLVRGEDGHLGVDQDVQVAQRRLVHPFVEAGLREGAGRAEAQLVAIVGCGPVMRRLSRGSHQKSGR